MSAIVSSDAVDGEVSASAPLWVGLPALYREPSPVRNRLTRDGESFVRRFTDALDEVLAPVLATLDNLPAYFDPKTAPEHVLDWLAGWVGLELFEKWPLELRRRLVADAVERHGQRGTKLGIEKLVETFVDPTKVATEESGDVKVTIDESGGVWVLTSVALDDGGVPAFPDRFPPDDPRPWMKITVTLDEKRFARTDEVRVRQLVCRVAERVKPAHVMLVDPVVVVWA